MIELIRIVSSIVFQLAGPPYYKNPLVKDNVCCGRVLGFSLSAIPTRHEVQCKPRSGAEIKCMIFKVIIRNKPTKLRRHCCVA